MKFLRRLILFAAMIIMAICVAIVHDVIHVDWDVDLRPVAIAAGIIALALLGIESYKILRSWQLPRPEDPPRTEKVILPKEPEKPVPVIEQAETFAKTAVRRVKINLDVEDDD
jgi:hypothetical protein